MDNRGNSRANTCEKSRLCGRDVFIRSKTNAGLPGVWYWLTMVTTGNGELGFDFGMNLTVRLTDFGSILLVFGTEVMINRDSWGHSYFIVRGEILGFMKDEQLRKHLPRMFSLIKNEITCSTEHANFLEGQLAFSQICGSVIWQYVLGLSCLERHVIEGDNPVFDLQQLSMRRFPRVGLFESAA
ncbi:predicted protein [Trichoplax adhaerens]|uniref:Uncharacterized protein n=1 Tax=Trichoplax adhaerens TaxID=10228 RepID=B3SDD1_TRIAD|nr:predicted protein [Trichoplax adhaerens]EDV19249.1 predicted protein [Trichoplax adhaerens]|eukprot:XP_002118246.1 predicted protein [Trichoplax adhaerens]